MSPLHRRRPGVDKLIADSTELRQQLADTVEQLDRFVEALNNEIEHKPKDPREQRE
ncbi:MAG: hypothetical protein JWO67_6469 [Streptosporangiaceae bacterium]|nr:hypothetical protein [Streptosporangiaceae bacterium]